MKLKALYAYLLAGLLPSVLISFALNSVIFVLLSALAFFLIKTNYPDCFKKRYLLFSTFIASIIIGLLLDLYHHNGFDLRQITKRIAFVLIPVIIVYSNKQQQIFALRVMVYFISFLSTSLLLIGLFRSWLNRGLITYGNWDSETTERFYSEHMLLNWGELSYKRIFLFLDLHPSYYAFFSIVTIMIILFTPYIKINKWLRFTLVLLHSFFIILISSKAGIASLLILMSIEFFRIKNSRKIMQGALVIGSIIILSFSIPSTQLRLKQLFDSLILQDKTATRIDNTERLLLWNSVNEFSLKELFVGTGIRTSKIKVNQITGKDKNIHSQFLQALISSGVVGLFLLIAFLLLPLWYSKNIFTYSFIILLLLNLALENMLDRIWGIMLVSFFYGLFVFGDKTLFIEKTVVSGHASKR